MPEIKSSVLILGYMRFENIKRLLDSCVNEHTNKIYLALDGAKDDESRYLQDTSLAEVLEHARNLGLQVVVRRRHSNAGLAVAVIEGISWFFEHEEFGIILEDDLELSPSFFKYISTTRDCYQNQQVISLISGNNYFPTLNNISISATHYPLIWGWATWRDEWEDFVLSLQKPLRILFNWKNPLIVNIFWLTSAIQSRFGLVDSWAMSFSHYIRVRDKLCVLPPRNLVSNLGTDSVATHSSDNDEFIRFPLFQFPPDTKCILPSSSEISTLDSKLENYIFRIRPQHLFSPLKLMVKIISGRRSASLRKRLALSSIHQDYSISRGD